MYIQLLLFILIGVLYSRLLIKYRHGWYKLEEIPSENKGFEVTVDVIIPFRNEEKNMNRLIHNLQKQIYSANYVNFILVDDHSEDQSNSIARQLIAGYTNFLLLSLEHSQNGKKEALKKGLSVSMAEVVVFTDADCSHSPKWLLSLVSSYMTNRADLVIGPVIFNQGISLISRFSEFELAGLMGSTASSAYYGKPVMCNGANLLIKRKILKNNHEIFNEKYASGDDMFVLSMLKKKKEHTIVYQKSTDAWVYTSPPCSLRSFLSQRIRWVSKNKGLNDMDILYTSLVVFLFNSSLFYFLFMVLINKSYIFLFLIFFLIKTLIDAFYINPLLHYARKSVLLKYIVVFQIFNVIYVPVIAVWGSLSRFRWKGRIYKK